MNDLEKLKIAFSNIGIEYSLDTVFEGTELSIRLDKEYVEQIGCELGWIIFLFDDNKKFKRIEVY